MRDGVQIKDGRVGGALTVTRAFGDFDLKSEPAQTTGLTALPEVKFVELGCEDQFIILASDGLWVVVSSEQAVACARAVMKRTHNAQKMAEALTRLALDRGSEDNVAVLVLKLSLAPCK